ncbi:MAG: methylmalonyl-CoA carboxyltransferase [Desulfohalobiaceae bacterium]|nr:methylmalonyl-CoA carboxyltransferase [Desulfohalobiaceae bacterium]
MSMKQKLEELERRRQTVENGGGQEGRARQHEKGKKTARERIELLFDAGSFKELDVFISHRSTEKGMQGVKTPGEGVVTGYGSVDGRLVYCYAQDFTVMGGSLGEMHAAKINKVQDLALKTGAPVIGINDSGGARIQEGVASLSGYGHIFFRNTIASGVIPQISVIMGPCAGGAVYSPALTDFIFMVEGSSKMFITGPQVIKAVTGEDVSAEDLGGAATHTGTSGVAHFRSESDEHCLQQIKRLLSYLPANNLEDPPALEISDDPDRIAPELDEIIPDSPNKAYDMKAVISRVVDDGDFLEVQPDYARNMLTIFARMNGKTIGIIANQPKALAGCLDINASDKGARFIRFCDAFNIPILTLMDIPGFLPGTNQEFGGIIRHGAKMLYAYSEATVPKVTLVVRKGYGGGYIAMCNKELGADQVFAWPTAEIAVMGPEGAANIIYSKEIQKAEDPEAKRREKIDQYREEFANPYKAGSLGYIQDVLQPSRTRPMLISALEMLAGKRETRPAKKHGNMPL